MGGLTEKVIDRNTTIPVSRAQEFTTYKDGQTAMLIHVVQGERELVSDCRSLARFELRGIPPMVAGAAKIGVVYQVDADGLLSVSATELSTGVEARVEVKPSFGLSENEVMSMLKASFDHAKEDVETRSLTEARVDAVRVIDAVKGALEADGEKLLSAEEIDALLSSIQNLEVVLGDPDKTGTSALSPKKLAASITDLTTALSRASDEFAARRMNASVRLALAGHNIDELEKG
jgi:molecular chaperone HscA